MLRVPISNFPRHRPDSHWPRLSCGYSRQIVVLEFHLRIKILTVLDPYLSASQPVDWTLRNSVRLFIAAHPRCTQSLLQNSSALPRAFLIITMAFLAPILSPYAVAEIASGVSSTHKQRAKRVFVDIVPVAFSSSQRTMGRQKRFHQH